MTTEYLTKATENLQAAEMLFEAGLHNASANRAYYAAFHAAIAVLAKFGISNTDNPHEWVQAMFAGELIHRKKIFPLYLAGILSDVQRIRNIADYKPENVSSKAITRQIKKAKDFIEQIKQEVQP